MRGACVALVVLVSGLVTQACSSSGSGDVPIVLGDTQTVILGGYVGPGSDNPRPGAIDFATGVAPNPATPDLGLGSNLELGASNGALFANAGQVASIAAIALHQPLSNFGGTIDGVPGVGFVVRAHDGCVVAVRVVDHVLTATTNEVTLEYARADCVTLTVSYTVSPAQVSCPNNQLHTSPKHLALGVRDWPPIDQVVPANLQPFSVTYQYPRGSTVTIATDDAIACSGSASCTVTVDQPRTVDATITWMPMCFPGP